MLLMERYLVVHYHELGLKKGNRDYFEKRLCQNIRATLANCGCGEVRRISGRLLVTLKSDSNLAEIRKRMSNVVGMTHFAEAWKSPTSLEKIEENAWSLVEPRAFESFRVETRRADKRFPHTSVEINRRVGAYIQERCRRRVDLTR